MPTPGAGGCFGNRRGALSRLLPLRRSGPAWDLRDEYVIEGQLGSGISGVVLQGAAREQDWEKSNSGGGAPAAAGREGTAERVALKCISIDPSAIARPHSVSPVLAPAAERRRFAAAGAFRLNRRSGACCHTS